MRLHRDGLASVESERHRVLTRDGDSVRYEILVVATGARSREVVSGAATFRGPMSAGLVEQAIDRVFANPSCGSPSSPPRAPAGCCRSTSWRC